MRFLSPEWLDAAGDALRRAPGLVPDTEDTAITLQQVVTGGPDGEVAYRIRIDHGSVELLPGRGDADVVFTEDWDTAADVAIGRRSPQAAFLDGRVRVGGDVAAVVEA